MRPRWLLTAPLLAAVRIARADPPPAAEIPTVRVEVSPDEPAPSPPAPAPEPIPRGTFRLVPGRSRGTVPALRAALEATARTWLSAHGFTEGAPTQETASGTQSFGPSVARREGVALVRLDLARTDTTTRITLRACLPDERAERQRAFEVDTQDAEATLRNELPVFFAPLDRLSQLDLESLPAFLPDPSLTTPVRRPPELRNHTEPFDLAFEFRIAGNPGRDGFVNVLPGLRAGWFPHDRIGIVASASYGNFRGRDQRVSNGVFTLGLETAIDVIAAQRIYLPIRLVAGYLPLNGPMGSLTMGVHFPLRGIFRMEAAVGGTVWGLPGLVTVSIDGSISVVAGLPPPAPSP